MFRRKFREFLVVCASCFVVKKEKRDQYLGAIKRLVELPAASIHSLAFGWLVCEKRYRDVFCKLLKAEEENIYQTFGTSSCIVVRLKKIKPGVNIYGCNRSQASYLCHNSQETNENQLKNKPKQTVEINLRPNS